MGRGRGGDYNSSPSSRRRAKKMGNNTTLNIIYLTFMLLIWLKTNTISEKLNKMLIHWTGIFNAHIRKILLIELSWNAMKLLAAELELNLDKIYRIERMNIDEEAKKREALNVWFNTSQHLGDRKWNLKQALDRLQFSRVSKRLILYLT